LKTAAAAAAADIVLPMQMVVTLTLQSVLNNELQRA